MKRLSTDKYPWVLRVEYYKTAPRDLRGSPYERFGQWVWNTYGIITKDEEGKPRGWPELFYVDENAALAILCKYYEEQHHEDQASVEAPDGGGADDRGAG